MLVYTKMEHYELLIPLIAMRQYPKLLQHYFGYGISYILIVTMLQEIATYQTNITFAWV